MVSTCPGCGAAVEYSSGVVRAVHGTCSACGGTFTIVEPAGVAEGAIAPEPGEPRDDAGRAPGGGAPTTRDAPPPGPPCRHCGAPLALRSWTADLALAACASCGSTVAYRTMPAARGPRGAPAGDFGDRRQGRSFPGPRGKPCRECGGPLTFSTDAEGIVSGECASCGNRFTLPPRPSSYRSGTMGREPRFSRGFSPRFRRPRDRSGEDEDRTAPGARPRRTFRRRPRTDGADESEYPERRRRRPRED